MNSFLSALSFYTRIPVPFRVHSSPETLNKGTKFLPLIGTIIGGIVSGVFFLSQLIFSIPVSIVLSMISSVLITGAFHEDGFSDTCDGLGGGWTREDKLRIMKDSRVGAYGLTGTILMLLLKFTLLNELTSSLIVPAIISVHTLSRLVPVLLIQILPYVRMDETSKIKPAAQKISITAALFALFSSVLIIFLLNISFLYLLIPAIVTTFWTAVWFKRKMGGYTGDMLGASQQISEVILLAGIIVIWNYIL